MHAPRCLCHTRVRRDHLPAANGARERHRGIRPACLRRLLAAGDLRRSFAAALCALVPRRARRSSFCTPACRGARMAAGRARHSQPRASVGRVTLATLARTTRPRWRLRGTSLAGTLAFTSGALAHSAQVAA